MKTSTHPHTREIERYVLGCELSTGNPVSSISEHIGSCASCAVLAEEYRAVYREAMGDVRDRGVDAWLERHAFPRPAANVYEFTLLPVVEHHDAASLHPRATALAASDTTPVKPRYRILRTLMTEDNRTALQVITDTETGEKIIQLSSDDDETVRNALIHFIGTDGYYRPDELGRFRIERSMSDSLRVENALVLLPRVFIEVTEEQENAFSRRRVLDASGGGLRLRIAVSEQGDAVEMTQEESATAPPARAAIVTHEKGHRIVLFEAAKALLAFEDMRKGNRITVY